MTTTKDDLQRKAREVIDNAQVWTETRRGQAWRRIRKRPDGLWERRDGVGYVRHLHYLPPCSKEEAEVWMRALESPRI